MIYVIIEKRFIDPTKFVRCSIETIFTTQTVNNNDRK